ncbi:MAG: hypothetical protein B6D58_02785 [candidate division Zixibacteria bacterium 4484_95]|nr:MAG: hypothetical protein B6D58_02785 [candidate division Zixibacteria bacterium 4484_95]
MFRLLIAMFMLISLVMLFPSNNEAYAGCAHTCTLEVTDDEDLPREKSYDPCNDSLEWSFSFNKEHQGGQTYIRWQVIYCNVDRMWNPPFTGFYGFSEKTYCGPSNKHIMKISLFPDGAQTGYYNTIKGITEYYQGKPREE